MWTSRQAGCLVLIGVLMVVWSGMAAAEADVGFKGWGLRGGLTVDPDQIFIGGHLDLGEFVDHLHFMPNVTAGFGDDLTIIALSPDVAYAFSVPDIGALYVGGLLTFQWLKYDLPDDVPDSFDDTDTELGLHAIGGLTLEAMPIFFELNVGIDDAPDLKAAIGCMFR